MTRKMTRARVIRVMRRIKSDTLDDTCVQWRWIKRTAGRMPAGCQSSWTRSGSCAGGRQHGRTLAWPVADSRRNLWLNLVLGEIAVAGIFAPRTCVAALSVSRGKVRSLLLCTLSEAFNPNCVAATGRSMLHRSAPRARSAITLVGLPVGGVFVVSVRSIWNQISASLLRHAEYLRRPAPRCGANREA